jgi:hypothetical protein
MGSLPTAFLQVSIHYAGRAGVFPNIVYVDPRQVRKPCGWASMEALAGVLKPCSCAGMKAPAGVLKPVGCASMEALAGKNKK